MIQFLYGEDGMDGRWIESQKFNTMSISSSSFRKTYVFDVDDDAFADMPGHPVSSLSLPPSLSPPPPSFSLPRSLYPLLSVLVVLPRQERPSRRCCPGRSSLFVGQARGQAGRQADRQARRPRPRGVAAMRRQLCSTHRRRLAALPLACVALDRRRHLACPALPCLTFVVLVGSVASLAHACVLACVAVFVLWRLSLPRLNLQGASLLAAGRGRANAHAVRARRLGA